MGDLNAKVGSEKLDDIVGPQGLGDRNERGERLIEWVQVNGFMVGNTWSEKPVRRRWNGRAPGMAVETKSTTF